MKHTETEIDGIAIIGMSGRFPGAADVRAFWRNLVAGVESISRLTDTQLLAAGVAPELLANPDYVKARGLLEGVEDFDAAFFGYAPAEAARIDPQHRVFLECAWEALEDAGYDPERVEGLIGVYAGQSLATYLLHHLCPNRSAVEELTHAYQVGHYPTLIGNDKDYLATRCSYKLNLRGPSVAVQSACSTSLVAVCQAVQSLLTYQCDLALAGGVSIAFPQHRGYLYQEGSIASPDGHCRAFDAKAQGTVFGAGCGIVILKRLEEALRDGDRIDAVIRGAALNNDGSAKASFSAPSPDGQAEVVALAHALAGVEPDTIHYIEAHGTGTPLGDPIEVEGLTQAFRLATGRKQFCALGSVKPNVGHLEAASGVTGLIKTALALRHRLLPPTLHFTQPNPRIDFANSPFYVNTSLTEWPAGATPRRAGVSSFGVGGTNAHLVLEEAPEQGELLGESKPDHLLTLSARTPAALDRIGANLVAHLRDSPQIPLAEVAYTLQAGRCAFAQRRMLVCRTREEAIAALEAVDPTRMPTRSCLPDPPAVTFLFPGQGAQYLGMGQELYASEPLFRAEIDRGAQILTPLLGLDPRIFLTTEEHRGEKTEEGKEPCRPSESLLSQTRITQPVLFLVEMALARLWMSWGVMPQAMIGHSLGEYTAACLAGVFTLEEGLALLAERGRLMEALPGGAMSVVRLAEEELLPLLPPALAIGALNAPGLCTVSGSVPEIEALEGQMAARGIACHRLKTTHAFHSAMMDPILDAFAARVAQVALCPPQIPYLSNVTGRWITPEEATDPAYWAAHLRRTVHFADGMGLLLQTPNRALLEVGPGKNLAALARRHPAKTEAHLLLLSLGDPKSASSETAALTEALGRLWMAGVEIDWAAYHTPARRRRVSLPTYPFERVRCWVEPVQAAKREEEPLTTAQSRKADQEKRSYAKPRRHKAMTTEKSSEAKNAEGGFTAPHHDCVSLCNASENETLENEALREEEAEAMEQSPSSSESRLSTLEGALLELLHEMTGIAPAEIDPAASFLEMGLDSLFLTQAGQAMQNRFKVKVTFRHLLEDYPTPRALAGYLDSRMPAERALPTEATDGHSKEQGEGQASSASGLQETGRKAGKRGRKLPSMPGTRQEGALHAGASLATSVHATDLAVPHSVAEQVIRRQLEIMAQQLALLQGNSVGELPAVPSSAILPVPSQATASVPAASPSPSPAPAVLHTAAAQHGPFRPVQKNLDTGLTPQQQGHLEALIARYVARTPRSKELTRQHRAHLADPRVVSGFRANWKEMVYPLVAARSAGSRIWDVDGNAYVDVTMGFGVNLFGHSPEFITRALEDQLRLGVEIGPQSPLAGQAAKLICEMVDMERAAFCNTGSEAVMVAMRLARTVTGRDKIAFFTGDYHGTFDEVLVRANNRQGQLRTAPVAPGIPQASVDNVLLLDYGTPESLEILKAHAHELAAVMVEPVQSRRPDLQPAEFLHAIRELTREAGAALIFDEVITGFRCGPGGAQAHFGIRADLATYGKIVGGGMPIGVVAGSAEYMDALDGGAWEYGDSSFPEVGVTFFAGTFVRHPLALAAAVTVLEHLKSEGPALQEALNGRATRFATALNAEFAAQSLPIHIPNFGSIFSLRFAAEWKWGSLLYFHLREKGLHLWEGRPFFLSTAHTEEDIAFMTRVFRESIAEMQAGGFLPKTEQKGFIAEDTEESPASLPLTAPQREVWLAAQRGAAASCAFNESITLHLHGPLDTAALQGAMQQVVKRHEALRATFDASGERQYLAPTLTVDLRTTDIQSLSMGERQACSEEIVANEGRLPFDLERGPLLRAQLVRTAPEEHLFVLTAHHLVCDGWSFGVILTELGALYSADREGKTVHLEPPARFCDYVTRQIAEEGTTDHATAETYWLAQLQGRTPLLDLPTDHSRSAGPEFPGGRERLILDGELLASLRRLSAKRGCTLHTLLLGGFTTLLQRLTGQTDLIVGLPAAGQAAEENPRLVGHCVHLLPLRVNRPDDLSFTDHLAGLKRAVLDAYDHRATTFSTLLRKLDLPREPGRTPLVSVTFNVDRYPAGPEFAGLKLEITTNPRHFFQFDLGFNLIESADTLEMECDYRTDLFEPATIGRWLGCFRTLLAGAAMDSDRLLSRLPLLTPAEQQLLREEWSGRASAAPQERGVHEVFEAQAAERPDAIAIRFYQDNTPDAPEGALTYAELNAQADRWAHRLRALGVVQETKVGLCLERSPLCIIAMLAILKAGGAYVPLETTCPAERLLMRIEQCGLQLILTQSCLAAGLPACPARLLCLDASDAGESEAAEREDSETQRKLPLAESSSRSVAESLAYVMYTSGSSGEAQGVAIPHRGIVRLVCGADYVTLNAQTVCLHHSPVGFDASTFEIWGPLLNGGTLVLLPPGADTLADLAQTVARARVDTLWLTAGLFHAFVDHRLEALRPLRQLLAGGDVLSPAHTARCLETLPTLRLINGYGPTENTTFTCCHTVCPADTAERSLPIGLPIHGTRVLVLDPNGELCPIGVPGELVAGGDGLAREYLNRPDLTAERFIADPFEPNARLYRTGDRARWRSDGTLEFLGRFDDQVKVRGYRVEPGEIEQALRGHEAIRAAAVTAERGESGERRLVAYYCLRPARTLDAEALSDYLRAHLPVWLVPSDLVSVLEMPLTANGKLDRRALPQAAAPLQSRPAVGLPVDLEETKGSEKAGRNAQEEALARLWQRTLGVRQVGPSDDFFRLGGDSLLALRLMAEVERAFGTRLPLSALFQAPTVAQMARLLPGGPPDPLPVTGAQAEVIDADKQSGMQRDGKEPSDREKQQILTLTAPMSVGDPAVLLAPIRPAGSRPPLFCVHHVHGTVLCYQSLVRYLPADLPVYGLQGHGIDDMERPEATLEEIAADCIAAAQTVCPDGPFLLCGLSFGGVVALEMARQLQEQGLPVAFVGLLDTYAPSFFQEGLFTKDQGRSLWARVKDQAGTAWRLPAARRISYLRMLGNDYLRAFRKALHKPGGEEDLWTEREDQIVEFNLAALREYRPRPCTVPIVLFRAAEQTESGSWDPMLWWGSLLGEKVTIREVFGNHFSLIREPFVQDVAAQMNAALAEVGKETRKDCPRENPVRKARAA